jgi:hypothetical protein
MQVTTPTGMPGDTGLPTLSTLYVNGSPLDALNTSLRLNDPLVASQRESAGQQFFSTPTRPNGDTTRDVFAVSLSTAQRVNLVGFSLAHFPQRAWLQYLDTDGVWKTCAQQNGLSATISIQDCIPAGDIVRGLGQQPPAPPAFRGGPLDPVSF